jgi:transcriptional regulator with XRE-family HTH domain
MRILRESHDYSQDYVGSVLGIEQNTYSKLESGQIRLTVDRVKKLAELYKVEQDIFLSDTLPVINYNNGSCSHSNSVYNPQNYTDIRNEVEKEFMDRLLEEKDKFAEEKNEQIRLLQSELEIVRNEKEQLINLLEKLTAK